MPAQDINGDLAPGKQEYCPPVTYGILPPVQKTTVYLSDSLKERVRLSAQRENRSEAELIREAIDLGLRLRAAPPPKLPLFSGAPSDLAERADEYLQDFGKP